MTVSPLIWVVFTVIILGILLLDLGVFHRQAHVVSTREAAMWTALWVSVALLFNGLVYWRMGSEAAAEFLAGYLVEYSLSVDNIFVFIMLFDMFAVPPAYRHRVLFWGILGALVMRLALILVGASLIARFQWIFYVFGIFLIWTGARMALAKSEGVDLAGNPVLRWVRRFIPITEKYHGERFLLRIDGRLWATPLMLVLILVETTDLMFALDSIPAIFGITREPFIVYTSNVFAILGLRSLYFLLGDIVSYFRYLKYGLSLILVFIGVKMILANWVEISTFGSLAVVGSIIVVSIAASLLAGPLPPGEEAAAEAGDGGEDGGDGGDAGAAGPQDG
ncbi:MAG TPA: TerC family protein [Sphingobacteriaceae bacterium]|nr:TerC family protein [Sphingobacteriaceae bacterium]